MRLTRLTIATIILSAAEAKKDDGGSSQYDFLVVGGGTAGLAVANRLSEMKDMKVAIIEAGDSVLNNHNVSTVQGYGLSFGTEIDWAYKTKNQSYAGGSIQTLRAGKAVGGTSTINGTSNLQDSEFLMVANMVAPAFRNDLHESPKRADRCSRAIRKRGLELGKSVFLL